GVVTGGPYRWIRHPNYVAVFVELLALPLVHGAWLTALAGAALHVPVLRRRLALEESVLAADPVYRDLMGRKPRFVPRLGRARGAGGACLRGRGRRGRRHRGRPGGRVARGRRPASRRPGRRRRRHRLARAALAGSRRPPTPRWRPHGHARALPPRCRTARA